MTVITKVMLSALAAGFVLVACLGSAATKQAAADGPTYTKDNQLLRPADYRNWVYLSASVGLQYGPNAPANPAFENVYVNPTAYQAFEKTGKWPDKTMFVLELRRLLDKGTFARGGQYQGELIALEAAVKDERRFPEKWAYFGLGTSAPSAQPIPKTAGCFSCHVTNGAVENTFAQFYPTVLAIAKQKGTLNPGYLDTQKTKDATEGHATVKQ